ncbi:MULTISPECIES: hypothetical protein [unclassified Pseudoalteromonas]|uniref:hypothetical protein n=1 Tax=unclassified Pseudoalteromonas TaxID=194690 RepID=UPI000C08C33D|nr:MULTISPECIES: hypothetical protein [unclassified Pseudoalteromonas]MDP2635134.1 hypothetical protein [Pseudoalteromonas sp. 1_MG-2023]PHN91493.1 hypothetical protein CSC79_00150 [Pseudoalteromonas sp. 3D05]TGE85212.1 hypothetical protein C7Y70_02420 [Pseudoalteromonas sp. KS88]
MKKMSVLISMCFLAACSNTNDVSSNKRYTLTYDNGAPVSAHKKINDCNAAAVVANIREVNNWNSKYRNSKTAPLNKSSAPRKASCE